MTETFEKKLSKFIEEEGNYIFTGSKIRASLIQVFGAGRSGENRMGFRRRRSSSSTDMTVLLALCVLALVKSSSNKMHCISKLWRWL